MDIKRTPAQEISEKLLKSGKVIILFGARQVGKTTLAKTILDDLSMKVLSLNGDERRHSDVLSGQDLASLKLLVKGYDLLFIDEAQRIPNIGINLKILHDNIPSLKILVTGSSSFDLANKVSEPLTGRSLTYKLYPVSVLELGDMYSSFELQNSLDQYLVYGMYPELLCIDSIQDKKKYLQELSSAYLYKDVLEMSSIKHAHKLHDLLRLLAFQIGSEVSIQELATSLQMGKETVASYIDLLEKSFVLFRLSGYHRNLRKEVTKMDKIYFYDLGIRNTIIENHNPLNLRNDQGQLWENFVIAERMKYLDYTGQFANSYFWRTYTGAELDYVEERDGRLQGVEIKVSKGKIKPPKTWVETYDNADYTLVNKDNFLKFVAGLES